MWKMQQSSVMEFNVSWCEVRKIRCRSKMISGWRVVQIGHIPRSQLPKPYCLAIVNLLPRAYSQANIWSAGLTCDQQRPGLSSAV
jgi:hypothetical protein